MQNQNKAKYDFIFWGWFRFFAAFFEFFGADFEFFGAEICSAVFEFFAADFVFFGAKKSAADFKFFAAAFNIIPLIKALTLIWGAKYPLASDKTSKQKSKKSNVLPCLKSRVYC